MIKKPFLYMYRAKGFYNALHNGGRHWVVAIVGPRRKFKVIKRFTGYRQADRYIDYMENKK